MTHAQDMLQERRKIVLDPSLRKSILYRIQERRRVHYIGMVRYARTKWRLRLKKKWITVIVPPDFSEIITAW